MKRMSSSPLMSAMLMSVMMRSYGPRGSRRIASKPLLRLDDLAAARGPPRTRAPRAPRARTRGSRPNPRRPGPCAWSRQLRAYTDPARNAPNPPCTLRVAGSLGHAVLPVPAQARPTPDSAARRRRSSSATRSSRARSRRRTWRSSPARCGASASCSRRVVVVLDDVDVIAREVSELSTAHDWLFTSGGVGPTHDDVTIEAVAKAFGVRVVSSPRDGGDAPRALRRAVHRRAPAHGARSRGRGARGHGRGDAGRPSACENTWLLPGIPEVFRMKLPVVVRAPRARAAAPSSRTPCT